QTRGVAAHRRAAAAGRRRASRERDGGRRGGSDAHAGRAGRARASRGIPRRAPGPAVRVRAPGDRRGRAHAADAADRARAGRRAGRRNVAGGYGPLTEQDVTRWSLPLRAEAERLLAAAARANAPGRFQLEAAIQSAHAQRALNGKTDWEAIALLYEGLLRYAPTIGARVAYAAALAEARAADAGLAALDAIPADAVAAYQPYWALRGHLLKGLGRKAQARAAYDRAIGLSEDPALREFLLRRQ